MNRTGTWAAVNAKIYDRYSLISLALTQPGYSVMAAYLPDAAEK